MLEFETVSTEEQKNLMISYFRDKPIIITKSGIWYTAKNTKSVFDKHRLFLIKNRYNGSVIGGIILLDIDFRNSNVRISFEYELTVAYENVPEAILSFFQELWSIHKIYWVSKFDTIKQDENGFYDFEGTILIESDIFSIFSLQEQKIAR